jgi:hypothetical protein
MTAGAFQSITSLAVNALMTFFILFFLLRDGRSMLRRAVVILPLKLNQVTRLYRCVKDTLNAIVYGNWRSKRPQSQIRCFRQKVRGREDGPRPVSTEAARKLGAGYRRLLQQEIAARTRVDGAAKRHPENS